MRCRLGVRLDRLDTCLIVIILDFIEATWFIEALMAAYILFGALLVQMVELVIKGCDMLRRLMQVRLVVQTINRELGRVRVPSLLIYATLIVTWRAHIGLYMEFYR